MPSAESETRPIPKHFHSLDALRGIAALSVVFWHWRHFFFQGTTLSGFDITQQPLYAFFQPLYTDGWRAVDLFFCLSGFIFFWLYREKIASRRTSVKDFFLLRFSRLYPLHALTLLAVTAGQLFMRAHYGSFFVYQHNDAYHFGLQTFFASNWSLERGYSFNGPIWSVSVEVLCYAIFFFVCFLKFSRWWCLALFACLGYGIQLIGLPHVGRGVFSFFVGGLAFQIFGYLARRHLTRRTLGGLGVITALLCIFAPLEAGQHLIYGAYKTHVWSAALNFHGKDVLGIVLYRLSFLSYELLLFPTAIITLALWEMHRGTLGRRFAFLGKISYSSYLLHFPLQMLFAAIAFSLSVQTSFFRTPWSLLLFFAVLIPLSLCSYRYFERPCQSLIRGCIARKDTLAQKTSTSTQSSDSPQ